MKSRWLKTKLLGAVLLRNCAGNKEHCARSGWSSAGNQSVEIIGSHQFPALWRVGGCATGLTSHQIWSRPFIKPKQLICRGWFKNETRSVALQRNEKDQIQFLSQVFTDLEDYLRPARYSPSVVRCLNVWESKSSSEQQLSVGHHQTLKWKSAAPTCTTVYNIPCQRYLHISVEEYKTTPEAPPPPDPNWLPGKVVNAN